MLFISIIDLSSHFDVMDLSGLSTTATETSLISQGDSDEACYGTVIINVTLNTIESFNRKQFQLHSSQ